jgi:hypothetical protein
VDTNIQEQIDQLRTSVQSLGNAMDELTRLVYGLAADVDKLTRGQANGTAHDLTSARQASAHERSPDV